MPHNPVPTAAAAAAAVVRAVKAVAFATASAHAVPAGTLPAFKMLLHRAPKSESARGKPGIKHAAYPTTSHFLLVKYGTCL